MATIQFFRETLSLNNNLVTTLKDAGFNPKHGDTLVFGARECTILSLPSDFDYIIAADRLTLTLGSIRLQDTVVPRQCCIAVLAGKIDGAFNIISKGTNGDPGVPGADGKPGDIVIVHGHPQKLPGDNGGNGGDGQDGHIGGIVRVHYSEAALPPLASAPGGDGGPGGAGGAGGIGKPNGKPGKRGANGESGPNGLVEISQVDPADLWNSMDFTPAPLPAPIFPSPRQQWAAYRTAVGLYDFRRFDTASQIAALIEFNAAVVIDPANADAQTLRLRLIQQQTPTGVSRDLDMSPVYKELSASLPAAAGLVQGAFGAVKTEESLAVNAEAAKSQLELMVHQLNDRAAEALDDVTLAQGDAAIAKGEDDNLGKQLDEIQKSIDAAKDQSFSFTDFVTDVGTISSTVIGIATGAGAIVSIPSAIKAFGILVGSSDGGDTSMSAAGLLELLQKKEFGEDLGKIGTGIKDLIKGVEGVQGLANFQKIVDDFVHGIDPASQGKVAELLKKQADLMRQKLIADLKQKQAQDRVKAAQRVSQDYTAEAQHAKQLHDQWQNTAEFLNQGIGILIDSARHLSDIVAEEVFLARRALEIYQLDDASDVRFDYGYIHPDLESTLTPIKRAEASFQTALELPATILTWNDVFLKLNAAQTGGFDVVHPAVAISITDPVVLAQLRAGGTLQFTIPAGATPASIFELKVNSLTMELEGASASSPALLWIQHSGNWQMVRRPDPAHPDRPPIANLTLFPHAETFNLGAGAGKLSASIPATPQSSSEPGPPFSFWGRGVIADWRIFPDPSATSLDLSGLTAIRLTINCIGLAVQGSAPQPPTPVLRPAVTVLPPRAPAAALVRAAG